MTAGLNTAVVRFVGVAGPKAETWTPQRRLFGKQSTSTASSASSPPRSVLTPVQPHPYRESLSGGVPYALEYLNQNLARLATEPP
jgi:hypothetical protein